MISFEVNFIVVEFWMLRLLSGPRYLLRQKFISDYGLHLLRREPQVNFMFLLRSRETA